MPLYEYRCNKCGHRFTILVGMVASSQAVKCPKCGSTSAKKLISRFARLRSDDDIIDDLTDRAEALGEDADPKVMREMAREMGKSMDEDMSDEMEELFEQDLQDTGNEDG